MSKTLVLTPQAEKDFNDACDWYERQDHGLGKEFARCVDVRIASIQRNPQHYQIINENKVQRTLVNRFPFSIYFVSEPDLIIVFAILHQYRNPDLWQSRT